MQTRPLTDLIPAEAAARLRDFRDALMRALPEAVAEMVLFGSRARGDAWAESDYDVAVFLRGEPDSHWRAIDELAFTSTLDGFDMQWVALPEEALTPAYQEHSELAARIALEGVPIR